MVQELYLGIFQERDWKPEQTIELNPQTEGRLQSNCLKRIMEEELKKRYIYWDACSWWNLYTSENFAFGKGKWHCSIVWMTYLSLKMPCIFIFRCSILWKSGTKERIAEWDALLSTQKYTSSSCFDPFPPLPSNIDAFSLYNSIGKVVKVSNIQRRWDNPKALLWRI